MNNSAAGAIPVECRVRQLAERAKLMDALLRRMQSDATKYLTPDSGCGVEWFVRRMLWHLDGPQQRKAQWVVAP